MIMATILDIFRVGSGLVVIALALAFVIWVWAQVIWWMENN